MFEVWANKQLMCGARVVQGPSGMLDPLNVDLGARTLKPIVRYVMDLGAGPGARSVKAKSE